MNDAPAGRFERRTARRSPLTVTPVRHDHREEREAGFRPGLRASSLEAQAERAQVGECRVLVR
jgi:methylphosphotriester-DNA--protein-cysteine methyltransferase